MRKLLYFLWKFVSSALMGILLGAALHDHPREAFSGFIVGVWITSSIMTAYIKDKLADMEADLANLLKELS